MSYSHKSVKSDSYPSHKAPPPRGRTRPRAGAFGPVGPLSISGPSCCPTTRNLLRRVRNVVGAPRRKISFFWAHYVYKKLQSCPPTLVTLRVLREMSRSRDMAPKSLSTEPSSDLSTSSQQTMERIAVLGTSKRRTVPPGFLGNYMQARAQMASVGLAGSSGEISSSWQGSETSSLSSNLARERNELPRIACPKRSLTFVPITTLPTLFAQRKEYLLGRLQAGQFRPGQRPYRRREGEPAGLLSLPEDVLVSGSSRVGW